MDDNEIALLIEEVLNKTKKRDAKRNNPWVLHLIEVLWDHGDRGLRRPDVIEQIHAIRQKLDLDTPTHFARTVQSAYNNNCSESETFKRRGGDPAQALFFPVAGKGSGKWGVRRDVAKAWLLRHKFDELQTTASGQDREP